MYPMISQSIKNLAIHARKEGFTISEIAIKYKIAESTVSLLVRDVVLNKKAVSILQAKADEGRLKASQVLIERREKRQEESLLVAERLLQNLDINKHI